MTDLHKAARQALGYPSLYDITGDIKGLNTLLVPVEEVKQLEEMNRQLREQNTSLDAECGRLEAENAELRGLKPEIPQRPPHNNDASHQHPALPRYGLRWNGPGQPVSVPMADGYWTPFHLALAAVHAALREALAKPAVPPGYALVPVEPTLEMLKAADDYHASEHYRSEPPYSDEVTTAALYRAMLAAAPQPKDKP